MENFRFSLARFPEPHELISFPFRPFSVPLQMRLCQWHCYLLFLNPSSKKWLSYLKFLRSMRSNPTLNSRICSSPVSLKTYWRIVGLRASFGYAMTLKSITKAWDMSSSPGHAGLLFGHTSEGLSTTCGLSWVSPVHYLGFSLHNSCRCMIEIKYSPWYIYDVCNEEHKKPLC